MASWIVILRPVVICDYSRLGYLLLLLISVCYHSKSNKHTAVHSKQLVIIHKVLYILVQRSYVKADVFVKLT